MQKPKVIDDPNEAIGTVPGADGDRKAKKELEMEDLKNSFSGETLLDGDGYCVKAYPSSPFKHKETYAIFVKGGWEFPSLTGLSFTDRSKVLEYFSEAKSGENVPEEIASLLPKGYDYRFGYYFNINIDKAHYSGFKALKERFASLDEMKAAIEAYIKASKKYTFDSYRQSSMAQPIGKA
jgi:hypothetical protein